MPEKTLEATFDHGDDHRRHRHRRLRRRHARCSTRSPRSASSYDDVDAGARGRGRREVRRSLARTAGHRRARPAAARRRADDADEHLELDVTGAARQGRRATRRSRQLVDDRVAIRHHRAATHAVGSRRRGRGVQAARLGRGRRRLAPAGRRDRGAARRARRRRASTTSSSRGMGGSSLAPEVIARTAGVELTVLDSHRPRPGARRAGRPARRAPSSSCRRKSGSHRRDRQPAARLRGGVPRRRHRPGRADRRRHRPGLAAGRGGARRRLPRLQRRPERRRPLLGADRVRAGAVRAGRRRHRRAAGRGRGRRCSSSRSTSADNPGLRPRRRDRRRRTPLARTSSASSTDGTHIVGLRRLGRAAHRRVHRQARHRHPARSSLDCPTPPSSTPSPADLQIVRLVDEATSATRERREGEVASSAARSARSSWSGSTPPPSPAGCSGINPFDQPDVESRQDRRPRPARRPPGADGARRSSTDGVEVRGDDPAARRRPSTVAGALDALLGAARPDDGYVAIQAYVDRLRHAAARRACATSLAARLRPPGHLRLGPAVPALHRPVPQGRPGRSASSCRSPSATRRRPRDPRTGRSRSAS